MKKASLKLKNFTNLTSKIVLNLYGYMFLSIILIITYALSLKYVLNNIYLALVFILAYIFVNIYYVNLFDKLNSIRQNYRVISLLTTIIIQPLLYLEIFLSLFSIVSNSFIKNLGINIQYLILLMLFILSAYLPALIISIYKLLIKGNDGINIKYYNRLTMYLYMTFFLVIILLADTNSSIQEFMIEYNINTNFISSYIWIILLVDSIIQMILKKDY